MDHLLQHRGFGPVKQDPARDMLEGYTTLGFLVAHTSRAKLLTMVTAAFYRQPGLLAKIVRPPRSGSAT